MPPSTEDRRFTDDDIHSALRNREMPLEVLRYEVTPTGLYYLPGHFDIPAVDPDSWTVEIGGLPSDHGRSPSVNCGRCRPPRWPSPPECAGNRRTLMDPFPGGMP
jgi:sulfane dehydrogenase subunit SoxC